MAKIIKVGPAVTPSLSGSIRTSRNSTTNPFKYSNFEGNTLPFADVFDGFEQKNANKLKLIASSVVGSVKKVRSNIAEPIVKFVKRIGTGITGAWDYAKNTSITDLQVVKNVSETFNNVGSKISNGVSGIGSGISNIGKGISSKIGILNADIADIGKGISSKFDILNTDVTDIGKSMSAKWTDLVSKVRPNKISANMSVSELESRWKSEIEGVA